MTTFENTGISTNLITKLEELGFDAPTPVQEQVIPVMLEKKSDIIALAQTGTGKTAAFGLPLLELVESASYQVQALVLCPTRELCRQVAVDLRTFAKALKNIRISSVYGGAAMDAQIREIRRGVQITVATPGRLNDLIRRRKIDLSGVKYLVFDEADEMLQMGFKDELDEILAHTPSEKTTCLFSATMSREVEHIARNYMTNPVQITVGRRNTGTENVRHEMYVVHERNRYRAMRAIIDYNPGIYSIIFCRTRRETGEVAEKLIRDGYRADALHGELSQAQRDMVMRKFRNRRLELLVATDVAARGLDVTDLSHVINYNLPDDIASYTHRSGRTGRAGKSGTSIAIVSMREQYRIKHIEKRLNRKFAKCRIPTGQEICKRQLLSRALQAAKEQTVFGAEWDVFEEIREIFKDVSRDELIMRLVAGQCSNMLEHYSNTDDLNTVKPLPAKRKTKRMERPRAASIRREKQSRERRPDYADKTVFTRFHLNVGRRQGIEPQEILGRLNTASGKKRIRVGKIDIMRNTAVVEAESRFTPQIMEAFRNAIINGRSVTIEVARNRESRKISCQRKPCQKAGGRRG